MSILPKISSATASLVVADLRSDPMDGQIAACVLQGIVNRTSAEKIYVHHTRCADNRGGWADPAELGLHMAHTAEDWLELVYADLPKNLLVPSAGRYPMLKTLLLKYHEFLSGVVVYDPRLEQATIELATTIAGQRDFLVVSPTLYDWLQEEGFVFDQKTDLRECNFKNNLECLEYALVNWFDSANHQVAFTWSHMTTDMESWGPANKDYVVANRLFTFYLDIFDKEERAHYKDVFDHYPVGTPILGWTDEIVADGLFAGMGRMMIPVISVENLSVSSSFETVQIPDYEEVIPEAEEDAVYLVFQVADGDNLLHSLVYEPYTILRDKAFGKVPAAWVLNPLLCEIAPRQLVWLTEHLRQAGQEPVAMLSDGSPDPDRYTGFRRYCDILVYAMAKAGMTGMKQMAHSEAVAWNVGPGELLSGYSGSDPRGIGPYETHLDRDTFHMGSVPLGECDLVGILQNAEAPAFISVFAGTAMSEAPARIENAVRELIEALPDRKLRFVTPYVAKGIFKKLNEK
ncbi:MAG: hypothetical protein E7428_06295 [Ruminococcaceae bacterium]|nr:hypothetical protein [Oscillospiraceae bacterium]